MRHGRDARWRRSRRAAALAGAGVLLGTAIVLAAPAVARQPLTARSVTLTVLSVTPSTPARSSTPQPLIVALRLDNTTDQPLDKITVDGARGDPIGGQAALDAAITHPKPPDQGLAGRFTPQHPVLVSLAPRASATVHYVSTSDTLRDDAGLCICQNRIYPLYFSVDTTDASGNLLVIGSAQTYISAFGESLPSPVLVSWVWPMLERPHRLESPTTFIDDELAASVAGGRLDRVLKVFEDVAPHVPMTLVVDPELIDELAVMSRSAGYLVESGQKVRPGVGTQAARTWLARLRVALHASPRSDLVFTPFADPDVESLTRNGLDWTVALGREAQVRVSAALGGREGRADIAWPAGEVLSADTLNAVVRKGATSVILSDRALPGVPGGRSASGADALASLETPAGPVRAAVTSSRIQRYVGPVLSAGGTGRADLPKLVAEVAIRAVEHGSVPHYVAITAPRTIDPNVTTAEQAIRDTAHAFWARPLAVGAVSPVTIAPADYGPLAAPDGGAPALSPLTISRAQDLARVVPALTTMLSAPDAETLLGTLPAAVQRAESTAWHSDPAGDARYIERLTRRSDDIESGVVIRKPSGGTYTLASSTSPLPVVLENHLNVTVFVTVRVTTVNGLPGFRADEVGRQAIPPQERVTLNIPTHVDRTGRFDVRAALFTPTPDGVQIGAAVILSVHSTALGAIGVIITVAATAVLMLALLVRFIRRMRNPAPSPGTDAPLIAP